jgi:deoxyribodipyrimidine photo-lyase
MSVEPERIQKLNKAAERPENAHYVLYWAQMNRRVNSNHALLFAAELANKHSLPVLFYEAITCTYEYANDRLHAFMLAAVPETARQLKRAGIGYLFYLRKTRQSPNDSLYRLARHAAAVVTDDYPTFIARKHNSQVPQKLDVAYYVVDSSCIVPMSAIPSRQYGAYTIRPKINKVLDRYLKPADELKVKHRFKDELPSFHTEVTPHNIPQLVLECEIDHGVKPSQVNPGGRLAAEKRLEHFLTENLRRYALARNEPAARATSGLSPYLHFGQLSSLEVALAVKSYANEHKLIATEFLEELIVRRELAFNYARFVDDPGDLANLPDWCQKNMREHSKDRRDPLYTPKQLENTESYDELWNATQKEMLLTGAIHGYYRMYWGKKIIEWTKSYEEAAKFMIDMHGKYALDGRDPATYTNILWCLGLHDRPWPSRPVFGTFRFMSLDGMKRKSNTRAYIEQINSLKA